MGEIRLSALVIARNEEAGIARCLASLAFCDEIVLVDAESTDRTVEVASRYTDRVFVEPWRGYAGQKSFALGHCRGTWVLWVDADEVVSAALAGAIRAVVEARGAAGSVLGEGGVAGAGGTGSIDPSAEPDDPGTPGTAPVAYALARKVHYLGAWIRHSGWGEDRVVRLFRRGRARFSDDRVHERLLVDGAVGRLAGVLEHYSYKDLTHHWEKVRVLAALGAEQAQARGRRARSQDLVFRPLARWLKLYVLRRGFLDGWRGAVIAGMGAAYVLLKYALLREKETQNDRRGR